MGFELRNRNCRVALSGRWHEQIDLQSGSPAFLKGRRVLATIQRGNLEKLDARFAQQVYERRYFRERERLRARNIDVFGRVRNCFQPERIQQCSKRMRADQDSARAE